MVRAYLPFHFSSSSALTELFRDDLQRVAVVAIKAVLKHRKSLEIAHQQIVVKGRHVVLSTRITAAGDLVVDLDVGDPRLPDVIIPEDEMRSAEHTARVASQGRRRR